MYLLYVLICTFVIIVSMQRTRRRNSSARAVCRLWVLSPPNAVSAHVPLHVVGFLIDYLDGFKRLLKIHNVRFLSIAQ